MLITDADKKSIFFLNRNFQYLDRELNTLRMKINLKEGTWFIKIHTYSQKELLEELDTGKLYAVFKVIEDTVSNWIENNAVSDVVWQDYNERCYAFAQKTVDVQNEILYRTQSNWEAAKSIIKALSFLVVTFFPIVGDFMKASMKLLDAIKPQKRLDKGSDDKND